MYFGHIFPQVLPDLPHLYPLPTLCAFLFLFLTNTPSPMCCPDTPVRGHPPEYSLSTKRLLTLPSPEAMTIGLQWSLLISYPFLAGMLTGLILYGSCTGTAAEFLSTVSSRRSFQSGSS